MDEVIVVHVLSVEQVAVLPLAQVLGVDAVGSEEFLVGDAERLTDGLSYQLGLRDTDKRILESLWKVCQQTEHRPHV